MAFRKTLVHRLLNISKSSTSTPSSKSFFPSSISGRCHSSPSNPSFLQRIFLRSLPSEDGLFRRFLHQNGSVFLSQMERQCLSLPVGDKLIEKLRGINNDRIRLDTLAPPIPPDRDEGETKERASISLEDARKVLRVSQMEAVKARLRGVSKSAISYSEFVQICRDGSSLEHGLGVAKALDDSGAVLVLGNVVFLRPEQVARAIESVIPTNIHTAAEPSDPRMEELREMERRKGEIDVKAEAGVRRELWCGLAFLVVQTAGFMRLTFWELSWDVMEPVCFYVTSVYFMAGYAFFLRTARDPSFEGFFESRFAARQKRLMTKSNFDLRRFHELRRALGRTLTPPPPPPPPPPQCAELYSCTSSFSSSPPYCDCHRRDTLVGAVH